MVDSARQLLDDLMGRHRNLDASHRAQLKKISWDDPAFCTYYLVNFCPHDLFVNTKADLGPCPKLHNDDAKQLYAESRSGRRKRQYAEDFLGFCKNILKQVERKIERGHRSLLTRNKVDTNPRNVYLSKPQEQLNELNARIEKHVNEAEEAGHRGDVDQAQYLVFLCEQLKCEKKSLIDRHQQNDGLQDLSSANLEQNHAEEEKMMVVCEVCGAFLIIGDTKHRVEDHANGKQHLGFLRIKETVKEFEERHAIEKEEEDRKRKENDKDNRDRYRSKDRHSNHAYRHRGGRVFSKSKDSRGNRDRSYEDRGNCRKDRDGTYSNS